MKTEHLKDGMRITEGGLIVRLQWSSRTSKEFAAVKRTIRALLKECPPRLLFHHYSTYSHKLPVQVSCKIEAY